MGGTNCTRGWTFAGIFFSDSQNYEILWLLWDIHFLNTGSNFTRYLIKWIFGDFFLLRVPPVVSPQLLIEIRFGAPGGRNLPIPITLWAWPDYAWHNGTVGITGVGIVGVGIAGASHGPQRSCIRLQHTCFGQGCPFSDVLQHIRAHRLTATYHNEGVYRHNGVLCDNIRPPWTTCSESGIQCTFLT